MTFTTRGKLPVIRCIQQVVSLMTFKGIYSIIEVRLAQEQARSRNSVFMKLVYKRKAKKKETKYRSKN